MRRGMTNTQAPSFTSIRRLTSSLGCGENRFRYVSTNSRVTPNLEGCVNKVPYSPALGAAATPDLEGYDNHAHLVIRDKSRPLTEGYIDVI